MLFNVLGGAGDGGTVEAEDHFDAFCKFIALDGISEETVRKDCQDDWDNEKEVDENSIYFGIYVIHKL